MGAGWRGRRGAQRGAERSGARIGAGRSRGHGRGAALLCCRRPARLPTRRPSSSPARRSIGGARVLFAGVALWSLGTLIAPPAAKLGLVALCATRLFVGLGEGLAPSSATNVMARIVPE